LSVFIRTSFVFLVILLIKLAVTDKPKKVPTLKSKYFRTRSLYELSAYGICGVERDSLKPDLKSSPMLANKPHPTLSKGESFIETHSNE